MQDYLSECESELLGSPSRSSENNRSWGEVKRRDIEQRVHDHIPDRHNPRVGVCCVIRGIEVVTEAI